MRIASSVFLVFLLAGAAHAQAPLWADVAQASLGPSDLPTLPRTARTVQLDRPGMAALLAEAPVGDVTTGVTVPIPLPEGGTVEVRVAEASMMAPALQARYPEIRTYLAQGSGAIHGRLSLTPRGFAGMLFTPEGTLYIDPYARDGSDTYLAYRARDLVADPALRGVKDDLVLEAGADLGAARTAAAHGATLRTYRLAVAATGEYTAFHGSTVPGALAAIVTTMNRVTGIYERDFSVTFELVADNDQIIFTDAGTDPYSNTNGSAMLSQNQAALDAIIGTTDYDIGHVFSTGGGGVAYLRSVCDVSIKAGGVTGSGAPVGDAFDVDYVAHEIGHQFGANHTQNNACNRNASTAYEPGSASTIMGYAGICPPNLQTNSDPYFHVVSLDEVTAFISSGGGASCGTAAPTGNPLPSVSATGGYTIPADTPFTLTGSASDDTPGALTYTWEEFDLGSAGGPSSTSAPFFRSFEPTPSPTRTFPQFDRLVDGLSPVVGETLPTVARTLNFRLIARDNRAGGGAIDDAAIAISTVTSAGPFAVTFASTPGQSVPGTATVTWDVAGTDGGAVNTPTVDVLFSDNGGDSFDYVLAAGTPNDGSQTVAFPVTTTEGRILVRAVGNVFFNVNPEPFEVPNVGSPPVADVQPGALGATLAADGTTTRTLSIANTAGSGAGDLSWSVAVEYGDVAARRAALAARDRADALGPLAKGDASADGTGGLARLAGGPDAFGYTFADSDEAPGAPGVPPVAFQDISATGTAVSFPSSDDATASVALPFAFPFYGADYASVTVSTNGFLSFVSSASAYQNAPIPTSGGPNAVIAPYWDDLHLRSGDVFTQTLGDGRFVIQWDGVGRFSPNSGQDLTFQVLLSPDGTVEVQYGTLTTTVTDSHTVGIESASGTDGLEVAFNTAYAVSGKAVRFRPPTTFSWLAAAPASGATAPGASDGVTVTFDAADLDDGTYSADLIVTTDDPSASTVTIPVTLTVGATSISIVIDGEGRDYRFLGPPAAGVTVDDLAAQNIVRGVPGYYDHVRANLYTAYDAGINRWTASTGTGEVLRLGHAFRWLMFDIEGQGDPAISEGRALPFTLATDLPANEADVAITLDTGGNRFNYLANPFGVPLDLSNLLVWPGGRNVVQRPMTYDADLRTWVLAPAQIGPWEMFRVRARVPFANGQPRTLTIPASSRVTGGRRTDRAAPPSLAFRLEGARADGGRPLADEALAFRFDADARAAFDDDEDLLKPQAPAEAFLALGVRTAAGLVAEDVRPFAPADVPLALVAPGAAAEMVLTWDAAALPPGMPVVLVDLVTGAEVDVRAQSRYAFTAVPRAALAEVPAGDVVGAADARDRFLLRIGARLAAAGAAEVALDPVVPNPSTGGARVRFVVPEAGPVRLTVLDARGREVVVLADGAMAAGRHEVRLPDGLAAGVYLVRLVADDALRTRTVAIVR